MDENLDDASRPELVAFLDSVVKEVPVLYPSLLLHFDTYGEVIPHVFFTELAEWVGDEFTNPPPTDDAWRFLSQLERSYPGSAEATRAMIRVSFLDEIPTRARERVLPHLGPALAVPARARWLHEPNHNS